MLKRFIDNEDGATAIEYGLIAALIAVAVIGVIGAVGEQLAVTFGYIDSGLTPPADSGA